MLSLEDFGGHLGEERRRRCRSAAMRWRAGQSWPGRTPSEIVGFEAVRSDAHVLPHHSRIFVLEDVTMVHKGMLLRRGPIEGHQKLSLVFDQNHVLPTRQMRRRRRTAERQN